MEFSVNLKNALEMAGQLATRTGGIVCTEHLLYGISAIADCKANKFLRSYHITPEYLISHFTRKNIRSTVNMSSRANRAVDGAKYVAEQLQSSYVGTEHLLYALIDDKTTSFRENPEAFSHNRGLGLSARFPTFARLTERSRFSLQDDTAKVLPPFGSYTHQHSTAFPLSFLRFSRNRQKVI